MLVVHSIDQLITVRGRNALRQGQEMNDVEIIENGYLVVENGKFIALGAGDGYLEYQNGASLVCAKGKIVTPGLIDSHTHLVHAGSRENEFQKKLNGVSYLEILASGGGILDTVEKTRNASFEELSQKAKKSLDTMLSYGVTTVEAKSGYGLDLDNELKQLAVVKELNCNHPIKLVSTFMGAHAIPKEYQGRKEEFIYLLKKILDEVHKKKLAEFCDVFCEEGVFSLAETEEILQYAAQLGFMLKMHADEIVPLGGAALAAKLGCTSAEHLMATTVNDMKLLAEKQVVANVLPLTSFYLDKGFAKVRLMIENNCGVAIATDYNPGSSPSENLQLAMQIASIKTKMTPKEVITAVTINGAASLDRAKNIGSIEIGKEADFVIFDCPNLDYLIYHFGVNHVQTVYINGKEVYKRSLL